MTSSTSLSARFPELERLFEGSEFLRAVAAERARRPLGAPPSPEMIRQLEANRCWAQDWSRVRLPEGFHANRLFDVKFFGDVELGLFTAHGIEAGDGVVLPAGVYNAVLIDCTVGDDCLIFNVGTLARTTVGPRSAIVNTRVVSGRPGTTTFGNGRDVAIVIETGGREVKWYAELTLPVATAVAQERGNRPLQEEYADFIRRYVEAARCERTLIGEGVRISSTGRVVNSFIGPFAVIDNAVKVENSTVLSSREEPVEILDAAYVNSACVQWGARVASASQVDRSVLCEHAGTDRHGRVLHSIIGPNTNIAGGEVTASLVGPFVGFHHQALLIAALWPEGRGNVAYGANVGSNHTSKAPDQEIWPGEGVFFGLGVNIKYPSNFTRAPYSIIATAVNMLPQRVEFPFSLINKPADRFDGISPAYNEITPAWVLSDQIYTVLRDERKYRERNRARHTLFDFEVFRPAIVDLMVEARRRLQEVRELRPVYTEKDVPGLGKNYMLESSRKLAIETYSFHIQTYALRGLKKRVEKVLAEGGRNAVQGLAGEQSDDPRWEHERALLNREFPGRSVAELLSQFVRHQERIARDVQLSKEKDDNRGSRIIPGYADAHRLAKDDLFVQQMWQETRDLKQAIEALLSQVSA